MTDLLTSPRYNNRRIKKISSQLGEPTIKDQHDYHLQALGKWN